MVLRTLVPASRRRRGGDGDSELRVSEQWAVLGMRAGRAPNLRARRYKKDVISIAGLSPNSEFL